MDGNQFNAEKPRRWMYLVIGVVFIVAFGWVVATSHFGDDLLPNESFAGCYVSANRDPLELDPSGALRSRGAVVGAFEVIAAVAGKHGPLISVDQTRALMKGSNVYFERGRGGYFWPITRTELQVLVYPGRQVTFQKASGSRCR